LCLASAEWFQAQGHLALQPAEIERIAWRNVPECRDSIRGGSARKARNDGKDKQGPS
jgi:hypothetical protein